MPKKNRLTLNFKLETTEERKAFLDDYLNNLTFVPTPDELETCANYLLYGKNQDGIPEFDVASAEKKQWDPFKKITSLDELKETCDETGAPFESFFYDGPPLKLKKETFSRAEAISEAPPWALAQLRDLWALIDSIDLTINYYDLAHGRRKNPPRADLLNKFTTQEQLSYRERTTHLNQFKYLKMRHLLVELRREQFTIRDAYKSPVICLSPTPTIERETERPVFERIGPIGLKNSFLFPAGRWPTPGDITPAALKPLLTAYWAQKQHPFQLNLLNPDHIFQILNNFEDLSDDITPSIYSNTTQLLDTLNYYIERANLTKPQLFILSQKIRHIKNDEIAAAANQKFNKSYTANYISTIYRQKIMPAIADAARIHTTVFENLSFPENFKKCRTCGQTLLRSSDFFIKRARAQDGFSNQCKICDKKKRVLKNEV